MNDSIDPTCALCKHKINFDDVYEKSVLDTDGLWFHNYCLDAVKWPHQSLYDLKKKIEDLEQFMLEHENYLFKEADHR